VDDIVDQVEAFGVRHICVTGGEPMLQGKQTVALMMKFISLGYTVLLETNGTIALDQVPFEVVKIVDVKTPDGLGMAADDNRFLRFHLDYENLNRLSEHDEVKFVITSRADYEWSRDFVRAHQLTERCGNVLFSPSWSDVDARDLIAWILEDRLNIRVNLQLHKYVWGADVMGV